MVFQINDSLNDFIIDKIIQNYSKLKNDIVKRCR